MKIYINAQSQNPAAQIISHELTHSIEASGQYSALQKLVLNRIQQTGGDLQALRQQKAELYARHGESLTDNAAIDSEIVAEYVEKYLLTDEQSIRAMVQQNRTLGQRILQFINALLAKLGSSDAQERAFLTQAKSYYQSALQETQSSFTADMQQRAAAQAQNMNTLQQQMANGEISDEDAEAAFNDMYDPELDMQQGLGGLRHSINNTRDMPWENQVRGYFSSDGTIKSSDSLYLGESGMDGVPMYLPTSVITKAIRPPRGSRSAHALSRENILNLQKSIKNAPLVIDNPARNSIVYAGCRCAGRRCL